MNPPMPEPDALADTSPDAAADEIEAGEVAYWNFVICFQDRISASAKISNRSPG